MTAGPRKLRYLPVFPLAQAGNPGFSPSRPAISQKPPGLRHGGASSGRQPAWQAEAGPCFHLGLNLFALELLGHRPSPFTVLPRALPQQTGSPATGATGRNPAPPSREPLRPPETGFPAPAAGVCHRGGVTTLGLVGAIPPPRCLPATWPGSEAPRDGPGRQSHAGRGGLPASPPLLSASQTCCCQVTRPAVVGTINFSSECFNEVNKKW